VQARGRGVDRYRLHAAAKEFRESCFEFSHLRPGGEPSGAQHRDHCLDLSSTDDGTKAWDLAMALAMLDWCACGYGAKLLHDGPLKLRPADQPFWWR
jgi:hypothetical protein